MPDIDSNRLFLTSHFSGDFPGHAVIATSPMPSGLPADPTVGDMPFIDRVDEIMRRYDAWVAFQAAVDDERSRSRTFTPVPDYSRRRLDARSWSLQIRIRLPAPFRIHFRCGRRTCDRLMVHMPRTAPGTRSGRARTTRRRCIGERTRHAEPSRTCGTAMGKGRLPRRNGGCARRGPRTGGETSRVGKGLPCRASPNRAEHEPDPLPPHLGADASRRVDVGG